MELTSLKFQIILAVYLIACCVQIFVVSDPVWHMLVQFPLLAAAGYILGSAYKIPREYRLPVFIIAVFALLFWMLPRSIDGALQSWGMHFAKFISIPLCIGLPLGLTFAQFNPIFRGFFKAQSLSMLGILGFLYTHAPIRICNSYLVDDQIRLGLGFFYVAIALTIYWCLPVFLGKPVSFQFKRI